MACRSARSLMSLASFMVALATSMPGGDGSMTEHECAARIAAAVAQENEACAKIADEHQKSAHHIADIERDEDQDHETSDKWRWAAEQLKECAAAIRTRSA